MVSVTSLLPIDALPALIAILFFCAGWAGRRLYQNRKNLGLAQTQLQFTENISHELQTPLAVIKGHAELLLQSPQMGEKEMEALGIILNNANRLSRINNALILLSKIEHKQFPDQEWVDIRKVVEESLRMFKDRIELRGLEVREKYAGKPLIMMNITLAEILVSNLLQNAIRHNAEQGWIDIRVEEDRLVMSNPGLPLRVAPHTLFARFVRHTEKPESLGLGLSIVKRICDVYGFEANYESQGKMHRLSVLFHRKMR